MDDKDLSPELIEEARSCKSTEELLELAGRSGYELTEDKLEVISGGWGPSCSNYCDCKEDRSCYSLKY